MALIPEMSSARMLTVFAAIGAAIGVSTKVWLQLKRYPPIATDFGFHLTYVRLLRRSGLRVPRRYSRFVLESPITYPWGLHWLLARCPGSWDDRLFKYGGVVVDVLHGVAVGVLVVVLGHVSNPTLDLSMTSGVLAASLFLISPHLYRSGSRGATLNPRAVGELLFTIAYALLLLALFRESAALLFAATFVCSMLWLTSKFAVQAMAFITPALLIASPGPAGSMSVLLFVLGSLAFVTLFSCGKVISVLQGHYRHSKMYLSVLASSHEAVRTRLGLRAALRLFLSPRVGLRSIQQVADKSVFFTTLTYYPLLCVLGVIWAVGGVPLPPLISVGPWIAAGTLAAILTNMRPLRFLGEPERYLSYVMFPVLFALTVYVAETRPSLVSVVGGGIVVCVVVSAVSVVRQLRANNKSLHLRRLIDDLNALAPATVLIIPSNLSYFLAPWTQHRYVFFFGNLDERFVSPEQFRELYQPGFPLVNPDLGLLRKRYDFDLVVCMREHIARYKDRIDHTLVRTDDYVVFTVRDEDVDAEALTSLRES